MSNASRPTWSSAVGSAQAPTCQYSSRDLTSHSKLKLRTIVQPKDAEQEGLASPANPEGHSDTDVKLDMNEPAIEASFSSLSASDSEDDTEALLLELEKIKREREAEKQKRQEEEEEQSLKSNPLRTFGGGFSVKRRWDDDVVFKNQARPSHQSQKKRFINDTLRSDFHKKFLNRYIK